MSRAPGRQDWERMAACQYTDPDLFFPEGGEDGQAPPLAEFDLAHRVCLGCPVRRSCLARALWDHEKWGMWGGVPERDLRAEQDRPRPRTLTQIISAADRGYFQRHDKLARDNDRRLAAYHESHRAAQVA